MSMTIAEANAANTLLQWVTGQRTRHSLRSSVTPAEANEAARTLIAKAYRALSAGLLSEEVDLTRIVMFGMDDDELYFVLSDALEEWAAVQRAKAVAEGGSAMREHWADVADTARERVKAAFNAEPGDAP